MNSSLIQAKELLGSMSRDKLTFDECKEQAILLAGLLLQAALQEQTSSEKQQQALLAGLMADRSSKCFLTEITDQCFRSENAARIADQIRYLIQKRGVPKGLPFTSGLELKAFSMFSHAFPSYLVPLAKQTIRKQMASVIVSSNPDSLNSYLGRRIEEGFTINLNHLGEAILGEEEARNRLKIYLEDLKNPQIEYISVKISSIFSQINLLDRDNTLEQLAMRLRELYRAAKASPVSKCVNLDMEEYRDLFLTADLFKKVLDEEEFLDYTAGIALQSYIPDSFSIQQQLTEWAIARKNRGGVSIRIRLVKGANLAMEKVEAALHGWPQAPYQYKWESDANFKRMLKYGSEHSRASAVHLGIASHNLFDISLAMILRAQNKLEKYISFEMLEGMAPHISRIVKEVSQGLLLYSPAADDKDFHTAVAYLIRRLDENTAPENFLHDLFGMELESPKWKKQVEEFRLACDDMEKAGIVQHVAEDRKKAVYYPTKPEEPFINEPDTDWTVKSNCLWVHEIIEQWKNVKQLSIPLIIGGKEIKTGDTETGKDPSRNGWPLYITYLADKEQIDKAVGIAKAGWQGSTLQQRVQCLAEAANELRKARGRLIGAMIADGGKTVSEADAEISEAIDFCEYYLRSAQELNALKDISWKAAGAVAVASPWNFPCSIPAGGIAASLAAGNAVIFKPAQECAMVGWEVAQAFWKAGIPKNILQFVTAKDGTGGTALIQHPDLSTVILTGATSTALQFLKLNPQLRLCAETGGKNSIIVTEIADRDLAIKNIIHSAFGHAGQKCSACSLLILLPELYDSKDFRIHLRDAAASLPVGSAWDMSTRVNPLIRPPEAALLKGLTVLEDNEEWLLQPKLMSNDSQLWSPGIKWGVTPKSFSYSHELFGPVLSVMRADNLKHAVELANGTEYGLTAGIHSLDPREIEYWQENIKAGNLYINRGITGAIVLRQPFGGTKMSSFGSGAKAGGPNYVAQLMQPQQVCLPVEKDPLPECVHPLDQYIKTLDLSDADKECWEASVGSYAFYQNRYFNVDHDPLKLLGQDNILRYVPRDPCVVKVQQKDSLLDVLRGCAAALIAGCPLQVSFPDKSMKIPECRSLQFYHEGEETFIQRISEQKIHRIRFLSTPTDQLRQRLAVAGCAVIIAPVLANGRLELLNYLREVAISYDYHRYGNLGDRVHQENNPDTPNGFCCGSNRPCCGDGICDETG